jgi:plastocyanin
MGKYLLIALVIVVLIAGGYFIVNGQNKTQQPAQNTQATQNSQPSAQPSAMKNQTSTSPASSEGANSVNYTSNGFEPKSITIKTGQTVTWTNKNSDDLWVASNPHPTHTDYPGFDELKGMSTGQTYSFTFTKVGKWGYHNHLNPSQQGEVVVTQ